MKLRINGNSLRLRLTPEEVNQLCQEGKAEDRCIIGDHYCVYSIAQSESEKISVNMTNGQVQVNVPKVFIRGWETDERVGFEYVDHNNLLILIEKDFKCLQPRKHEWEEHLYPNPATK